VFYALAAVALVASLVASRLRTAQALKKSWMAFAGILPQFVAVIVLVGMLMSVFDPETISRIIGQRSGWFGVVLSALVGAVTLIPGFVAFPTAALLLESGAGIMQIGAFVSALMMVGVVTLPVEMTYFGRKLSLTRNLMAFLFSFVVALALRLVVG
jgi:uncharacterized membrane protein YraQ (UPF0718 family)